MNNEILFLAAALVVIVVVYVFFAVRGDPTPVVDDRPATFALTCTRLAFLEGSTSVKYEEMVWGAPTRVTFISINEATLLACDDPPITVPDPVMVDQSFLLLVDAEKLASVQRESITNQISKGHGDRYLLDGSGEPFGVAIFPEHGDGEYAVSRLTDRLFHFYIGDDDSIKGKSVPSSSASAST